MTKSVYDKIGKGYSSHRRADHRLVKSIVDLLCLPEGSVVADIGAGTGNYTDALARQGYIMKAVEPSGTMRDQVRVKGNVEWINGTAEAIPLRDDSVNGVICILAFHHFKAPEKSIIEMARICDNGPILIFTFDPRQIPRPWLAEYFPGIWDETFGFFPPLSDVEKLFSSVANMKIATSTFVLPHDLQDHFMAVGWRRPELYLAPEIRACMSGFALADQDEVEAGVLRLQQDIETGEWEKKYGYLRQEDYYDSGYRFLCARNG